jgi:GAF domain-containing protein
MAEELHIPITNDRTEIYQSLLPQVKALVADEDNLMANLANVAAVLKEGLNFFWVGFYLADNEEELILGPFQGPIACTRIRKGKGVCGTVWENGTSLIVPDVDEFPGHIACSSASKSEIVLPLMRADKIIGVLDVDSDKLNDFSEIDKVYLSKILSLIP